MDELLAQLKLVMPGIPDADLPRFAASLAAPSSFAPHADAQPREGVPRGDVRTLRFERSDGIYPGVSREVQVYVPAGLSVARPAGLSAPRPAGLMVFQDGARYLGPEANAATVFDNLIVEGAMPPTVGIFVEPGEQGPGLPIFGGSGNRSVEYDSPGDAYARFLIEELIPEVTAGLPLVQRPEARAICGLSSGGICAFNAAWERPDYFGKVLSHCGSFVDIRGGHLLARVVRRTPAKPLRVFLQTGEHDLDILFGNWLIGNRQLASALAYRGYEHQLVVGPSMATACMACRHCGHCSWRFVPSAWAAWEMGMNCGR